MKRVSEYESWEGVESLQDYLAGLRSAGEASALADTFSISPERALRYLSEQGRFASGGLLYLLVVLYRHLQGSEVRWAPHRGNARLTWVREAAPPRASVHLEMARAALDEVSLKLRWEATGVHFEPKRRRLFGRGTAEAVERELTLLADRLRFYPGLGRGLDEAGARRIDSDFWSGPSLCEVEYKEGRLQIWLERSERGIFGWCIEGLAYYQRSRWPCRAMVFDDQLRADLTLSKALLDERSDRWLARSDRQFRRHLLASRETLPYRLRQDRSMSRETPPLCRFLGEPGLLRWEALYEKLEVYDVFDYRWTVAELLSQYRAEEALMIVERTSSQSWVPPMRSRKAVLVWAGEVAQSLGKIVVQRHSGEGYLYSLMEAARGRARLERSWAHRREARREHSLGELWLLPPADPELPFELICCGMSGGVRQRRVSSRPGGMRLLFLSEMHESDSLVWDRETFALTLEMLGERWGSHPLEAEQLRDLLDAAEDDWAAAYFRTASPEDPVFNAPCLETVCGAPVALAQVRALCQEGEAPRVPVTGELSAVMPQKSPFPFVLRTDPLLERLGLTVEEVGEELRARRWLEEGRRRWMESQSAASPAYGSEVAEELYGGLPLRLARLRDSQAPSFLTIWRENRILERLPLRAVPYDRGWEALWIQDDFPPGPYFTGGDPQAVSHALDSVVERLRLIGQELERGGDDGL